MRQLLIYLIILMLFLSEYVHADIVNGYSQEARIARLSMENLRDLIVDPQINPEQKKALTKKTQIMRKYFSSDYQE